MRLFNTRGLNGQPIWNWTVAPSEAGLVVLDHRTALLEDELEKRFGVRPKRGVFTQEMRIAITDKYPKLGTRRRPGSFDSAMMRHWVYRGDAPEDIVKFHEWYEMRKEIYYLRQVLEGKVELDAITMSPVRKGTERREIEGEGNWSSL